MLLDQNGASLFLSQPNIGMERATSCRFLKLDWLASLT